MKKLLINLILLISIGLLTGCSELEKDITQPPEVSIHGQDVLKPSSPEFHGKLIRNNNWDMSLCKTCHGTNYGGGLVKVSCLTCHNQPAGPENCSTCHGSNVSPAPPRDLSDNTSNLERGVGAHQVHLSGNSKGNIISCAECHSVPASLYQAGHVDTDSPAEVLMTNYLANLATNGPTIPNPVYNYTSASCSNTYCHGTFKNGNTANAPVWNDPNTAACGTCHGNPSGSTPGERALPKTANEGGTHPNNLNCSTCHGGVVNANLQFINANKHIDGKLNLFGDDISY